MKPLFIVLIFFSSNCFSQFVTLSVTKNNYIYLGLDNSIQISVSNYSEKEVKVKTNNGTIKGENGVYILHPDSVGICLIIVEGRKNKKYIVLDTIPLRVRKIDKAFASIGLIKSGEVKLQEFKVQQGLIIKLDYIYQLNSQIQTTTYKVIIYKSKTSQALTFENIGARFISSLLDEIKKLEQNDVITFYNIEGENSIGQKIYPENNLVYTMK
jgi:hypothetical protein